MLNFLKHPNFFNSFNVTRPCISFVLHSDENTSQVHCTSVVFLESGIRNQASLGESNVFGSIQNVLKCVKMKCRYLMMIKDAKVQPVMLIYFVTLITHGYSSSIDCTSTARRSAALLVLVARVPAPLLAPPASTQSPGQQVSGAGA